MIKPRFKKKFSGYISRQSISQNVFKALVKDTGIFVILLSQNSFESFSPEIKFQPITSTSQFEKLTVQKPIAELWTVISNQRIKYQLPHTRFDQISDNEHEI